jgi:hypothetical protein
VVRGSQCNWPARRRRGEETKSGLGEVTRCAGCKCSTGFEGHVAGGVGQASPRRLSLWALLSLHHALMTFSINWYRSGRVELFGVLLHNLKWSKWVNR